MDEQERNMGERREGGRDMKQIKERKIGIKILNHFSLNLNGHFTLLGVNSSSTIWQEVKLIS